MHRSRLFAFSFFFLLSSSAVFSARPRGSLPQVRNGGNYRPGYGQEPGKKYEIYEEPEEGESNAYNSQLDCTCMSALQCGGVWRVGAGDEDEEEENVCPTEGDVCCSNTPPSPQPQPQPAVPEIPEGGSDGDGEQSWGGAEGSGLQCGEARPNSSVYSSAGTQEGYAVFGELPWTVLLVSVNPNPEDNGVEDYRCSGSLVHPRAVLTAAHCVSNQDTLFLIVRAGAWDLAVNAMGANEVQERNIENVFIHPGFKAGRVPNDIAIIVLKDSFQLTNAVNLICLPDYDNQIDQSACLSSGWGKNPQGEEQFVMKKVEMPLVERRECQRALRSTRLGKYFILDKNSLCAGGESGKDVCLGDGGGPLSCRSESSSAMTLVGVTSWGISCGKPGIPGVFTDVLAFSSWVRDTLNNIAQ